MDVNIIWFILCLIGSFILGLTVDSVWSKPTGELVIDTSDPEKDKWLIRLKEPTHYAARRHIVKLLVIHGKIQEDE